MSAEAILLEDKLFHPLQVSEGTLEGLLRTHDAVLFDGLRYFDFRPPILGPEGVRHPDGALVAPDHARWWVVEVELHTHDVDTHIAPQLQGLADGVYGWEAFSFLERHSDFDRAEFGETDVWHPSFLLVVDHVTPQIRRAAQAAAFDVLECGVFRSERSEYALAVSEPRPRRTKDRLPVGVDVVLIQSLASRLSPRSGERFRHPQANGYRSGTGRRSSGEPRTMPPSCCLFQSRRCGVWLGRETAIGLRSTTGSSRSRRKEILPALGRAYEEED